MTHVRYLIVGGGVAGVTAAETIRNKDKTSTIHIVSDEPYRFYSRVMLSKPAFFLEKIPFDNVFMKTESWAKENGIGYSLGTSAVALDAKKKVVTLGNGETIGYDKLLLAVGADVRKWDVRGADKEGVTHLLTLDDAKRVIAAVKKATRAVVIGGGFIGFEMCDMLRLAGLDTTLVIREKYFWEPLLDEPSGRMIETALKKGGVHIIYETLAEEVLGTKRVEGLKLNNGMTVPADMVILGIGTCCPLEWVEKAGINCNRGILANEYLETSAPDVWTAGDTAEYKDLVLNENIQLGNWANAHAQGMVAAMNMLGERKPFRQASFYTAQGFGISIAFVGDIRVMEGREVITRGSPESNSYARIIVMNDEVEGATMINRGQDLVPLKAIIEADTKVAPHRKELGDPSFDLRNLVNKKP